MKTELELIAEAYVGMYESVRFDFKYAREFDHEPGYLESRRNINKALNDQDAHSLTRPKLKKHMAAYYVESDKHHAAVQKAISDHIEKFGDKGDLGGD
jgi:hypothetical protein